MNVIIQCEMRAAQSVQWLRYGLNDWDSIPDSGRISSHHRIHTGSEAHPAFCPMDKIGGGGGDLPEGKTDHWPSSSAEATNAWSYAFMEWCLIKHWDVTLVYLVWNLTEQCILNHNRKLISQKFQRHFVATICCVEMKWTSGYVSSSNYHTTQTDS